MSSLCLRNALRNYQYEGATRRSLGQLMRFASLRYNIHGQTFHQKHTQSLLTEQQQQQQQQRQRQENIQSKSQINASTAVPPSTSSTSSSSAKDSYQQQQIKHLRGTQQAKQMLETTTPSPDPAPPVNIPYNVDWVFDRIRNPSGFWYICSQIAVLAVGLFSKIVLVFMNNTRVYNKERLLEAVARRPMGVPLVTVSNHHSCFDDPGVWGKCIPVIRGQGVYQEAIDICIQKAKLGFWVHVFPEGKVNVTKEEMRLKWGVGRIIYESPQVPIILPMWHEGMDDVLPNAEPYIFKWGKRVTVNIGQPIDMNDFINDLKRRGVPEPEARKLITDKIQDVFHKLRLETKELHNRHK